MTLQADFAALDRASRLIEEIRQSIAREHGTLRADVDDLLAARWTGVAAGQFGSAWAQWCRGMGEILSGLSLESAAIAATRAGLAGSDADAATAQRRLHERMGEV